MNHRRGFATVQASRAPFGCALLGRPMSLLQIHELRSRANAAAAVLSSARVLGDAQWINVSLDQSRRLVSLIDAVKPSGPLLVDVIQAISIANFTDTDRRGLLESLSSSALAPKPTKWHPQSFADFPSFMTKDVWHVDTTRPRALAAVMQEEYNKQFPPMWAKKDRVSAAWYSMTYQLKESTGRVVPTWTRPGRLQLAWKRMWWKLIYADEMN